ncbi:MAG: 4-vinyl reductase [Gemmatimonadota bacterium]|nr:4-vinyl reductase [Gemmatimonadota bacterium]
MSATLPFLATRTVAVPAEFFSALLGPSRGAPAADAIETLRDAGYLAGGAMFDAFAAWLDERGEHTPATLGEDQFGPLVSAFFQSTGWGEMELTQVSESVLAIDAHGWCECEAGGERELPGCHVSTGMFAGFFGRLAESPLAVLEVECVSAGQPRCRFLLASLDVLQYVHEAMGRGIPYDRAASSAT